MAKSRVKNSGMIYVETEINLVNNLGGVRLRNQKGSGKRAGTFNEFVNLFRQRNERLAKQFSDEVNKKLDGSMKRPLASTGRLERALSDKRNRVASPTMWGYGNPAWLDRSPARYWRQIEEGTRVHLGRAIRGIWAVNRETGPYHGFNSKRNQDAFLPSRSKEAPVGIIGKPITPHRYMEMSWRGFNPKQRSKQALYDVLIEAGVITPTGGRRTRV